MGLVSGGTEEEWDNLHNEWVMLYLMVWEIETGEIVMFPMQAQMAFERAYPEWRWRTGTI